MKSEIKISNHSDIVVIDIEGVIGVPEQVQFDHPEQRVATYQKFTRSIEEIGSLKSGEVVVNIRSTGGDVNDALLIYEALISLQSKVTTRCWGYVASAATIIAQAASAGCRQISANALYLIHCSEGAAEGNALSLNRTKEMLDATDMRIADIYASRSGYPIDGFIELMNENSGCGRWISADEAIRNGLADSIIPSERVYNRAEGEGCTAEELASIARLFGLPDFPSAIEGRAQTTVGPLLRKAIALWRRLFGRVIAKAPLAGTLRKTPTKAHDRGPEQTPSDAASLSGRHIQDLARPTVTKQKEDPSPGQSRYSANDRAYYEDMQNIRIG